MITEINKVNIVHEILFYLIDHLVQELHIHWTSMEYD